MSKLSWMHRMGIPNLGQPYVGENGQWYADHEETGQRIFVPNRCCKCCITTDSQNDRLCDDCYMAAPFFEKYPVLSWIFPAVGVFALVRMIWEFVA